jgi:hypothetical protein
MTSHELTARAGSGALRTVGVTLSVCLALSLGSCTSIGVGIALPIPGVGSVGVGVDSSGQVGGGVSIGTGGVSVGVGGSARLPQGPAAPASAPGR